MCDLSDNYNALKKQYYKFQLKEIVPPEELIEQVKKDSSGNSRQSNNSGHSSTAAIQKILTKLDDLQNVNINKIKVSENPADDIKSIKDLVSSYFWSGFYLGQQSAQGSSSSIDGNNNNSNNNNNNNSNNDNSNNDNSK